MGKFLEEVLPVDIRVGATFDEDYEVDITITDGGKEYARIRYPHPRLEADITYTLEDADLKDRVQDLFHRAFGRLAAFRVLAWNYNSTAEDDQSEPAYNDQDFINVSAGVYQATKYYGTGKAALDIGYPYRLLYKIVANTMLVGIRDEGSNDVEVEQGAPSRWTVDENTGLITFATNQNHSISSISNESNAEFTMTGHSLVAGDSFHVGSATGMTEVNGLRPTVLSTTTNTVVTDLDSSGFGSYTGGAQANTLPQNGETVTGGCRFHIPMRFNSSFPRTLPKYDIAESDLTLIERIEP